MQVNIQEAIRLHETGGKWQSHDYYYMQNGLLGIAELEVSTKMFGKLADPNGANNALSQVLYGLALRYDTHPSSFILYCI